MRCDQPIVQNLFLYISSKTQRKRTCKKERKRLNVLTGCNVLCICATDCYILGDNANFVGVHKLYFYTQNCKLDFDRSLPNHVSLFEIV